MNRAEDSLRPATTGSDDGPSASLLVRCWLEPQGRDEPPVLRGYVKNLRTGEELYIKDLEAVGDQIARNLGCGAQSLREGADSPENAAMSDRGMP